MKDHFRLLAIVVGCQKPLEAVRVPRELRELTTGCSLRNATGCDTTSHCQRSSWVVKDGWALRGRTKL